MSETADFLQVLRRNGHVRDPQARLVPLNGGVSSEIYLVEDGARRSVVKRALAKLRVKDNWFADVGRNASERDYLECVGRMMPGTVPELYFSGSDAGPDVGPGMGADAGYFGMEYLGHGFSNWKDLLLAGEFRTGPAELAGKILGEIHRRTAGDGELRRQFDTTANFHQLRVEPYLLTTGERHPALQPIFEAEARRIEATREALVHGDFSPKNILIGGDRGDRSNRMVLLDCEVAWFGDPVFDVAFFLNHLFLKSLLHAPGSSGAEDMVDAFWDAYVQERGAADAWPMEERLVPLLLMLMLARVDGKSPVEYLTPPKQEFIRAFVNKYLPSPPKSLAGLRRIWFEKIATSKSMEANS